MLRVWPSSPEFVQEITEDRRKAGPVHPEWKNDPEGVREASQDLEGKVSSEAGSITAQGHPGPPRPCCCVVLRQP